MDSFKALDERNEMNLRVYEQCLFERIEDAKAFIEEGFRTGQKGEFFTVGPMKLLQDGSLGARTAAMNEPYERHPENVGISIYTQEELDDLFSFFDQHQMQAAVHCIGQTHNICRWVKMVRQIAGNMLNTHMIQAVAV